MKLKDAQRWGRFFRLLDANNDLSLTNIALVAVLVRILMMPAVDIENLAMFAATLIGYQVKRFAAGATGAPEVDEVGELRKAIETLQTKVTAQEMTRGRSF